MGQEKGPLASTEIELSSKYESKSETSTGSALPLYILSLSIPPPLLLLSHLLPHPYNMSQCGSINYEQII